jgi:hypothetical protein
MHYYMTRKAGSMIFRLVREDKSRNKKHVLAGQEIPADCLAHLGETKVASLVAEGAFVAAEDGELPNLGQLDVAPIRIGTSDKDFMPESQAAPGKQHDEALLNLLAAQEARKVEATIDEEIGGTPDGLVKVERPVDEDDEDDDEYEAMMTDAERDAIAAIEAGDRTSIFEDED